MGIVSIGQAVARHEDPRLLRGEGRYTADVSYDGQAYGYFLRSAVASAKIKSIDTSQAAAAPGVVAILTAADYVADGIGEMPVMVSPAPGFDGEAFFRPARVGLANGQVQYVGEPVVCVVADTLNQAKDAAELIDIDYDERPVVVGTAKLMDGPTPPLWDQRPDNLAFSYQTGDQVATDEAFATADNIVRKRIIMQRMSANPIENRATVATYDKDSDLLTVHVATQGPYGVRGVMAAKTFGTSPDKVRIVTGDMGGSFGMKSFFPEMAVTAWAAKRLGRPVKWANDRHDSLQGDYHGRDKISDAELALSKDGKFLGLRVRTAANLGGYVSMMGTFHTTLSLSGHVGVYDFPTAHIIVDGYFSSTSPTAPYRGAARPDASYVIERLVDAAAADTGIDRIELRRRNLIPASAMPYKTALGPAYDCGDFGRNMDAALAALDFAGFEARRADAAARGILLGFGLANNIENAGAPGMEFAKVRFAEDGSVLVTSGTTDQGQGHSTMYAQILSDRLGVDLDRINVRMGDTNDQDDGRGTGGSRVSAMGSGAIVTAIDQVIEQGRKVAAEKLETAEADIVFENGSYKVVGTDQVISVDEIVRATYAAPTLPDGVEPGLAELGAYEGKAPNWPTGCHACEVEVDRDTGRVALTRYFAVNDLGQRINPLIVDGQLQGGIMQGVGQALLEEVIYDPDTGQLATGSFQDYCMPRASDMCDVGALDQPTFTKANPLGAKGVGEVGTACAVPAVVNAVIDALKPYGVTHLDTPLTSEKVWRAINGGS